MPILMGWEDKHFYQLLCIHRLRWCHNSVYTIDILALSGNEHFDTRTLIKSMTTTTTTTRYCVNISTTQGGCSEGCNYLTSVSRCLWCVRHLVYIYYMKVTWATALPFALTLVFGACIQSWSATADEIGWKGPSLTLTVSFRAYLNCKSPVGGLLFCWHKIA